MILQFLAAMALVPNLMGHPALGMPNVGKEGIIENLVITDGNIIFLCVHNERGKKSIKLSFCSKNFNF
jgi:hypothetical protein